MHRARMPSRAGETHAAHFTFTFAQLSHSLTAHVRSWAASSALVVALMGAQGQQEQQPGNVESTHSSSAVHVVDDGCTPASGVCGEAGIVATLAALAAFAEGAWESPLAPLDDARGVARLGTGSLVLGLGVQPTARATTLADAAIAVTRRGARMARA